MSTRLKDVMRRVPGLVPMARRGRSKLNRALLTATERRILARPDHEILVVFGMRRSGNHVAISWILDQTDGPAAFYNNIDPGRAPGTARMTEYRLRRGGRSPRIVLSYEDASYEDILAGPLAEYLAEREPRSAGVRFALILRDPYNLFASRLRKWPERFMTEDQIADQIALYSRLAALAADPRPLWGGAPLVPVLYNTLIGDAEARDRIADALGIRRGARGLDRVPAYGHGSSFDGTGVTGENVRAHVLDRWREAISDPAFQTILNDPGIRSAGQALFGMDPPDQR